jgi:hypothetical protein
MNLSTFHMLCHMYFLSSHVRNTGLRLAVVLGAPAGMVLGCLVKVHMSLGHPHMTQINVHMCAKACLNNMM